MDLSKIGGPKMAIFTGKMMINHEMCCPEMDKYPNSGSLDEKKR